MTARFVTLVVLAWVVCSSTLQAQGDRWAEVQALPRGRAITVIAHGKPFKAELQQATESTVVLVRSGDAVYLDRAEVERVSYLAKRPVRFPHIRLVVGLLIGIPLGAVSGQGTGNSNGIPIMMASCAGLGAWFDHKHRQATPVQEIVVYP